MADASTPSIPSSLPVLPLRNMVAFPMSVTPMAVNRPTSIDAVNRALTGDRLLFMSLQASDSEAPGPDGPQADGHRRHHSTDGARRTRAANRRRGPRTGLRRHDQPHRPDDDGEHLAGRRRRWPNPSRWTPTSGVSASRSTARCRWPRALAGAAGAVIENIDDPLRLAYLLASLLDMPAIEKQAVLEADTLVAKLEMVSAALAREITLLEVKGTHRIAGAAGDDGRAAAVLPAAAVEGDPG